MSKPLLPKAERLLPYLKRIDESRQYSNYGPLNDEYQQRLGELFEAPCVTGSSATSLITATLMAYDLPKGSFVAMPSWTFPATAAAVVAAGLEPYFCDVTPDGVMVTDSTLNVCKAVVLVSPFGKPIRWFDEHYLPTVIDAAAGFDSFSTVCKPLYTPIIISTHATKAFGTGEGGLITCHNKGLLEKIRRITNFGLSPDRRIDYTGMNGKLSEYHAAVGLAELDGWQQKRGLLLEAVKPYGIDYAITQVPVTTSEGVFGRYGCHIHKAYEDCPRTNLPVTEELIRTVSTVQVGIE